MQACETPAEAVIPVVQECTDKKITVGGKTYPLPTTKAVSLNPAYKAELKSLVELGAVKEVQE